MAEATNRTISLGDADVVLFRTFSTWHWTPEEFEERVAPHYETMPPYWHRPPEGCVLKAGVPTENHAGVIVPVPRDSERWYTGFMCHFPRRPNTYRGQEHEARERQKARSRYRYG